MPAEALKKPDEGAMARILARHPYSPEGVILRLAWQEGLSRKELNELTWDQVDFDGGSLLLPDRTVPWSPPWRTASGSAMPGTASCPTGFSSRIAAKSP